MLALLEEGFGFVFMEICIFQRLLRDGRLGRQRGPARTGHRTRGGNEKREWDCPLRTRIKPWVFAGLLGSDTAWPYSPLWFGS